jgi:excinuclease ABC subunit C
LRLIQKIRDESHRFAITFHRERRSRRQRSTGLDEVPGVGPKTVRTLLDQFGSVDRVRAASREDLLAAVNRRQADAIVAYFKNSQSST